MHTAMGVEDDATMRPLLRKAVATLTVATDHFFTSHARSRSKAAAAAPAANKAAAKATAVQLKTHGQHRGCHRATGTTTIGTKDDMETTKATSKTEASM